MKKQDHLPVFGVGPFCVYAMLGLLVAFLVLRYLGLLDDGDLSEYKIPMIIIGIVLIIFAIYMWIQAVIIDKVGDKIVGNHLLTTGIYAFVRNPIYSAAAIGFIGIGLCFFNAYIFLLIPIYWAFITLLMIFTEERWLLKLYGQEYIDYCRRVNRVIPWFPRRKRPNK